VERAVLAVRVNEQVGVNGNQAPRAR
jgi:hypothetical protein